MAETVSDLIAKPALDATDYARLANDTVAFASQPQAPKGGPRTGVLDDALAAVERGEPLDAKAADWPALRAELERLKQVKDEPPPQNQPPPQEQKKDQQQSQGGGEGQSQDQQQQGSGGQQDEQQAKNGADPTGKESQSAKGADQSGEQKPQDAASDANDAKAEDKAQTQAGAEAREDSQAGNDAGSAAAADAQPPTETKDDRHNSAQETARPDEAKPIAAPEASLGEPREPQKPNDAPAAQAQESQAHEAPQQPASRMVGGGRPLSESESEGDLALAEALGRMQHVKDGDAPAVLFDRMNRAEGRPRSAPTTKNW